MLQKEFCLLCSCLLLLSLSACSSAVEENPFVTPSTEVSQGEADNIKFKTPEEVIGQAKTAYGWFKMVPLEVDYDVQKEIDGLICYKVKDDRYDTREKLDQYLRTLFSSDIVNHIWSTNIVYKESDEFLYCTDGGRGQNIFIEDEKYDTEELSDKKIVYTINVTYSPESGETVNPREYEYVMEKIDGNWVFTVFPFYW